MLNKKLEMKLNEQITVELKSAYSYLSMSHYFTHEGYAGFAKWMRIQATEELGHAMKISDFLNQVGAKISLGSVDAPKSDPSSAREAFEIALKQEKELAKGFNEMASLALAENEHAGYSFVEWFVNEQVEEVALCSEVLQKFDLLGASKETLYMLNCELGKREG